MLYYLTDELFLYKSQFMSVTQHSEAQQKCVDHAGGEFSWVPASKEIVKLPKDEMFVHLSNTR